MLGEHTGGASVPARWFPTGSHLKYNCPHRSRRAAELTRLQRREKPLAEENAGIDDNLSQLRFPALLLFSLNLKQNDHFTEYGEERCHYGTAYSCNFRKLMN